jgi:hypothetical protein
MKTQKRFMLSRSSEKVSLRRLYKEFNV